MFLEGCACEEEASEEREAAEGRLASRDSCSHIIHILF